MTLVVIEEMVEISPEEFARTHKGLIKLLRAIEKSGSLGIASRKLCEQEFNSRHYCNELLEFAKRQGYITRKREDPEGKGNKLHVNRIAAKGKKLLKELRGKGV